MCNKIPELPNVRKVGTGRLTGKYISSGRGIGVIVIVKGLLIALRI